MAEKNNTQTEASEKKLTLDKFEQAYDIVKQVTRPTALIESEFFSQNCGNKVYLKPENMQVTGAYKIRGAYYKISTLSDADRKKGLITASAGNHAQGVAYAAKAYGVKATIVMPTSTPLIKVNRTKAYGAEVVLFGDVYDDACQYALKLAEEKGYTFIHPFDDLDVATGQSTVAMEILKEAAFSFIFALKLMLNSFPFPLESTPEYRLHLLRHSANPLDISMGIYSLRFERAIILIFLLDIYYLFSEFHPKQAIMLRCYISYSRTSMFELILALFLENLNFMSNWVVNMQS